MKTFLMLWACVNAFFGVSVLGASKGAVHDIEAGLGFLSMTICLGFVGVLNAIETLHGTRTRPES
jgi:hypothetical protein